MLEGRKPCVLVVDDEKNILEVIGKILRINNFETVLSSSAEQALELLKNKSFDILITDHLMPNKTGLELIIESKKNYPDMVKVLLTGVGNRDLYREAIIQGDIFSIVEKPFLTDLFLIEVNRAAEHHQKLSSERQERLQLREQYHTIFDKTTDLIQCVDTQGQFIYVNPAWYKTFKFDKTELSKLTTKTIVHSDYIDFCDTLLERTMKGENIGVFEYSAVTKDGSIVYFEGTATAQLQDSETIAIIFILRNITEKKIAEEEIRQRLRQEMMLSKVAKLLASTDEPFSVYYSILDIIGESINADYALLNSYNQSTASFEKITEWFRFSTISMPDITQNISLNTLPYIYKKQCDGEAVFFSDTESIPEPDRTFIISKGTKAFLFMPIKIVDKTVGSIGFVNYRSHRTWEENEILLLKAVMDILANAWRRQLEIEARKLKETEVEQSKLLVMRADRLSSLGTMTAGIIHEITQPLNAINVSAQTILYGFQRGWELDSEQAQGSLNLIIQQIRRITEIIRNMRAFARDGLPAERELDSLNVQVGRIMSLFGEQLKAHNINIELDLGTIPETIINSQQILQIILNLITNARQALDEIEKKDKLIKIRTFVEKDSVCLEVADNGPGIPESLREKIFDPFFSTKEVGKGTGLGLSISMGFANDHNGVIDFYNNEYGGASFLLKLPLSTKQSGVEN